MDRQHWRILCVSLVSALTRFECCSLVYGFAEYDSIMLLKKRTLFAFSQINSFQIKYENEVKKAVIPNYSTPEDIFLASSQRMKARGSLKIYEKREEGLNNPIGLLKRNFRPICRYVGVSVVIKHFFFFDGKDKRTNPTRLHTLEASQKRST